LQPLQALLLLQSFAIEMSRLVTYFVVVGGAWHFAVVLHAFCYSKEFA
jgi:hypothetical protein